MLKIIALVVGVLVGGLLVFAATRPDTFRVERVTTVNAPAERIFPMINDFHRWSSWSPYEKLDPAMEKTYSGAPAGTGAVYQWAGEKAGAGRMEIVGATPPSNVTIKLDFDKPFEAHNTAEFLLKEQGGVTEVTWAMYGPSPFMSKVMQVFMSMDDLVGKDFENGLADLKTQAEAG